MTESPQRLGEVLGGASDDRTLAAIRTHLGDVDSGQSTPWFLQPFIFGGALLAALMLTIGFVELFDLRFRDTSMMAVGGVYILGGIALHRLGRNVFLEYLGLSCSIGGHAFFLAGLADTAGPMARELWVLIGATGLCAGLYSIYRTFLHRLGSCLLVFGSAKLALPEIELADALHGCVAAAAATCGWLLTRPRSDPALRPLAYACGCGLMGLLLPISDRGLWFDDLELPHRYISSAIAGIALLGALHFAASRLQLRVNTTQRVVAVLLVSGLGSLSTPGIPAALFLIVLGHAAHHWPIAVIGLAGLPVFLWKYYYNLELDFMTKSGVLAGSGVLLLLARWLLTRRLEGIEAS